MDIMQEQTALRELLMHSDIECRNMLVFNRIVRNSLTINPLGGG